MSMEDSEPTSAPLSRPGGVPSPPRGRGAWFLAGRTNPWLVFLLPFLVYMLVGCLEPGSPADGAKSASGLDLGIEYRHYPLVYSLKVLLTIAAMAYVYPGYGHIPCRITPLAIPLGIVGAAAWIALAISQREVQERLGWSLGLDARSAFNPLDEKLISSRAWAYCFLAIRFVGLAIIVPVIEEFFLRGFVMRFVMAADWWTVPIGTANRLALIAGTVIPLLTHPFSEALAVSVWFSAVTWLLLRTRNLWSCVAAHATTNLFLGLYVVKTGFWWLI
jgi:CAAX prenyl protease-like protein